MPEEKIVTIKKDYSPEETTDESEVDDELEGEDDFVEEQQIKEQENQVVHTKSVSIKGVLKGRIKDVPVADKEISEEDQVTSDEPAEARTIEITENEIQNAWKEYAQSVKNTHPRIFSTLNQQVPTMTDTGIIQISLNTNAQREYFLQSIKPELTLFLKKKFGELEFVFETNLIDNETTVKKVYTDHDKLDYMTGKNPAIEKLRIRFNLDFDN